MINKNTDFVPRLTGQYLISQTEYNKSRSLASIKCVGRGKCLLIKHLYIFLSLALILLEQAFVYYWELVRYFRPRLGVFKSVPL